jgi:hypothetical protein
MKKIVINVKKGDERIIKEFDSFDDAIEWLTSQKPADDLNARRKEALRNS